MKILERKPFSGADKSIDYNNTSIARVFDTNYCFVSSFNASYIECTLHTHKKANRENSIDKMHDIHNRIHFASAAYFIHKIKYI